MKQGIWPFGVLFIIAIVFVLFVPKYPDVKNIDIRSGEVAELQLQNHNLMNN